MSGDEKELSESYGYSEKAEDPQPSSEEPQTGAPYIRNNDKATDYRSTGLLLTVIGGLGVVFVILTVLRVIPEYLGNPYLSYGVLFAVSVLFLVMGITSIRSAGIFEKKAKSDHTLEKRILDYVEKELDHNGIDELAGVEDGDEPEILYFKRADYLKKAIGRKFVGIDPAFLDDLIDDKIYDMIFEERTE